MKTEILTDLAPLESILRGAELLYKAVSTTMGPRGRNVIFRKHGHKVGITHDGVTVAKMVKSNNEDEDVGVDILREAALKMDAQTGDGTTTVTVLAYHILKEAVAHIKNGESPMKLKLALDALQPQIIEQIEKYTDKDVTEKKLIQIASVASGSADIGETVGKIVFDAGTETPILLGFSEKPETHAEVIKGFKIDSGPASPYLMEGAGVRLEIMNPSIIVADAKLRSREDVLPLLQAIAPLPQEEHKFLLVCSDIAGDALAYMVMNRLKGFAEIAVARVPEHIQSHSEYLSDLAVACGAQVLSRNTGNTILDPKVEHFGKARKVTVEPRETVIIEGGAIKEDFDTRIESLRDFKENGKTTAARKFASDRLMTLEQKVISIFVGGQSETEAEERHYRFEDAVGACRAALRGGVVPGGGTFLYCIGRELRGGEGAQKVLSQALKEPMCVVLENAGINLESTPPDSIGVGKGFDVMHPEDGIIDLVERGILDPAESEIECVKTAISIAGLLMTAGAMVVDKMEGNPSEAEQGISISQG